MSEEKKGPVALLQSILFKYSDEIKSYENNIFFSQRYDEVNKEYLEKLEQYEKETNSYAKNRFKKSTENFYNNIVKIAENELAISIENNKDFDETVMKPIRKVFQEIENRDDKEAVFIKSFGETADEFIFSMFDDSKKSMFLGSNFGFGRGRNKSRKRRSKSKSRKRSKNKSRKRSKSKKRRSKRKSRKRRSKSKSKKRSK